MECLVRQSEVNFETVLDTSMPTKMGGCSSMTLPCKCGLWPKVGGQRAAVRLPKLRDRDGSIRKRLLYFAIDRAPRYVRLAVKDDETTASAADLLTDELKAFSCPDNPRPHRSGLLLHGRCFQRSLRAVITQALARVGFR